jgi:choline dehydrogenase-like flavoprotein
MNTPDLIIVGSGIMGAAVARLVREVDPLAFIVMVDGGPVIGSIPGQHLHDSPEPEIWKRYNRRVASGVQAMYTGADVTPDIGETVVGVEPGMYNLSAFGDDAADMPGSAVAWNTGGMGVHWTAACPWPWGPEVPGFLPTAEWEADLATAKTVLGVHTDAFAPTASGMVLLDALDGVFGAVSADGRHPQNMPMAIKPTAEGTMPRTGPNRIFPPIASGDDANFVLLPGTLCVAVEHADGVATGVVMRDVATGNGSTLRARAVVVCADTVRTPQLLFASDIRPPALGRYLNEHAFLTGRVFPDTERLGISVDDLPTPRAGEWVTGSYWLPQSGDDQPFHGQIMERPHFDDEGAVTAYSVSLAWYVPTEIRAENRLEFSDDEKDATGMPRLSIRFDYSEADLAMIERARASQKSAGERLGSFDPATQSAILTPGSSLHFTGTVRMGTVDDGTSVCDTDARVWGFDNLFLAGNGVIPTPVTANSTLTGTVFAVRTARAIAEALARG